jgi:hypothetical protein
MAQLKGEAMGGSPNWNRHWPANYIGSYKEPEKRQNLSKREKSRKEPERWGLPGGDMLRVPLPGG